MESEKKSIKEELDLLIQRRMDETRALKKLMASMEKKEEEDQEEQDINELNEEIEEQP
jgi:hypothetical protein